MERSVKNADSEKYFLLVLRECTIVNYKLLLSLTFQDIIT